MANLRHKLRPFWGLPNPKRIQRWRLGQRIAAGYGIVIAIGSLGSLIGIVVTDYFQGQQVTALGDAATQDRLLSGLHRNLRSVHLDILQLETRFESPAKSRWLLLNDVRQTLLDSERLVDELHQHLNENPSWLVVPPDELQAISRQSLGALQGYVATHFPDALSLDAAPSRPGDPPMPTPPPVALEKMVAAEKQLMESTQVLVTLFAVTHSKLEQVEVELEMAQGVEKGIIFTSLFLSALVAGIIAWGVTQQITRPLTGAAAIVQKVVETGEFQDRITPELGELHPETEIGVLARSLDTLMDWVAARNQSLAEQATQAQIQAQTLQQTLGELRRTQVQLIQTEKMSLLGQVAAGVAHEINNPVSFIQGNLDHIGEELQDVLELLMLYEQESSHDHTRIRELSEAIDLDFLQTDLPNLLRSMRSGSERIREIVLSLRLFARLDESELKMIDLNDSIDSVVTILGSRLCAQPNRPAIAIIQEYGTVPPLECYAGQLNQTLMHLMANAIDALEDRWNQYQAGGADIQPPLQLTITTLSLDTYHLRITITDTGLGIPDSILPNIFEMFYSTKAAGKGTGMGLAIAHQVITDKHGGTLQCSTQVGQGTTFTIDLPLSHNAPTVPRFPPSITSTIAGEQA